MKINKIGGWIAIYNGCLYLFAMVFYMLILKYHTLIDPVDKINLFIEKRELMFILNFLTYTVFGFAMIPLSLAIRAKLKFISKLSADFTAIVGIIWGAVIIFAGMISNIGTDTVIKMFSRNKDEALVIWQTAETICNSIGGSTEILGGVWTFVISVTFLRAGLLPKPFNILGIICGTAGILSDIPMLRDASGIFAITQIIWFVWLGILLINDSKIEGVE